MNLPRNGAILRPALLTFTFAAFCCLYAPGAAACPYDEAASTAQPVANAHVDEVAATHTARAAVLVGANCSYSTGLMARRVIAEGRDWTYVGSLAASGNDLASRVATPFHTVGGDPGGFVVATEILETLVVAGYSTATLSLAGRSMEIDGIRYVVLTSFRVINA